MDRLMAYILNRTLDGPFWNGIQVIALKLSGTVVLTLFILSPHCLNPFSIPLDLEEGPTPFPLYVNLLMKT